jgi:hypothetical protein
MNSWKWIVCRLAHRRPLRQAVRQRGQALGDTAVGAAAKMSAHGAIFGKKENRKEIANICMMHKEVYVAQTTCAHPNHFYKTVMGSEPVSGSGDCQRLHHLPARTWRGR